MASVQPPDTADIPVSVPDPAAETPINSHSSSSPAPDTQSPASSASSSASSSSSQSSPQTTLIKPLSTPPSPSRHAILQSERVLAAIEARLRKSACASSAALHDVSLEALGDAYRARLAGHALDNLDRAIISYRLAERRLYERASTPLPRARVLAKLGRTWYARLLLALQMRTVSSDVVEVHTHGHLQSALDALDQALELFEQEDAEEDGRKRDIAYVDALFCRGMVCDRLYQTFEIERPGKPDKNGSPRMRVTRDGYVKECIVSLERVLDVGELPQRGENTNEDKDIYIAKGLRGFERAQAVMCLARAYSNVDGGRQQIGKAVGLLAKVDGILREVEADGKGGDEVDKMREDAEAQIVALSGSAKVVESRCVVC